jgi:hypothetical protein
MQRGDLTAVFPSKGSASAPAPNDHLAGISQSEELSPPAGHAGGLLTFCLSAKKWFVKD